MTDHDLQQGANAGAWSGKELNLVQRQERSHGRGIPELTVRPIGRSTPVLRRGQTSSHGLRCMCTGCCFGTILWQPNSWRRFRGIKLTKESRNFDAERQLLTERLEQRLQRGGFDLSRVREDHRLDLATRYVETYGKIADLHRHERWLETANGLGNDWRDRV